MGENTNAEVYKKMYHRMFHAASAAEEELLEATIRVQKITMGLKQAQRDCEELFLNISDDQDESAPSQDEL